MTQIRRSSTAFPNSRMDYPTSSAASPATAPITVIAGGSTPASAACCAIVASVPRRTR